MFLLRESDIPSNEIITGSMILEQSKKPLYYFKLISISPKVLGERLLNASVMDEFSKYSGYVLCGDSNELKEFLIKIIGEAIDASEKAAL